MKTLVSNQLCGSPKLETSAADAEIIPANQASGENPGLIGFALQNDADCHIKINGGDYVLLRANQGFTQLYGFVRSCKIQEDGVPYSWIGQYSGSWK